MNEIHWFYFCRFYGMFSLLFISHHKLALQPKLHIFLTYHHKYMTIPEESTQKKTINPWSCEGVKSLTTSISSLAASIGSIPASSFYCFFPIALNIYFHILKDWLLNSNSSSLSSNVDFFYTSYAWFSFLLTEERNYHSSLDIIFDITFKESFYKKNILE